MDELLIGPLVGAGALLVMAGIVLWFLRGIQKDDREISEDSYRHPTM